MSGSHLDRAVAPNLFDALSDPGLIFSLILANLMSPRLWELRDRLMSPMPNAADKFRLVQQLVDRHFEHVTPARIAEINGVLDLDAEAARLGSAAVETALAKIRSTLDWRIRRGTLQKDVFPLDLIGARKFPAYLYSTIDEAWASRRLLHHCKHKPLGLTCCLDEAAIFIALGLILPGGSPGDFAVIGSPAHYSVLACAEGEIFWFYTKHELYSAADWSRLVAEKYLGDIQAAFDDRLPNFDRIVTVSGSFAFGADNSIAKADLAALVGRIDGFFGGRLRQLDHALQNPPQPIPAPDLAATIGGVLAAPDASGVRLRLRRAAVEENHPAALAALYAFRTLDLPDLRPYLVAARRNCRTGDLLGPITTIDDAVRAVATIPGNASIFDDPERIAMPDETVRFGTGTDRDKALLLHVLVERTLAPDNAAPTKIETLFTEAGSYVQGPGFCISTSRMMRVPTPEGAIRGRIASQSAIG